MSQEAKLSGKFFKSDSHQLEKKKKKKKGSKVRRKGEQARQF